MGQRMATSTAWERFWAKVDAEGDCWEWTAALTRNGYGQFWPIEGVGRIAHRWAWTELVGPVPEGLDLDHLCRNRKCVNPDHLEPVTRQENVARGAHGAGKPLKTHCPAGHSYQENLLVHGDGRRRCRICWRETSRRAKARYRMRKRGE